ncbi:methyltransferase domain-containing protein [Acaryochloris sp. IP29b_bin.148]|uniref:methyltransferase domain-containing protein n=1 Tax=Acaryochloris sp. IP29b_bin.148 TaxID=2969218 RepID=UPI0034544C8E
MYTWNAQDYAENSTAQQTWARELMAKLKLQGHEHILDLGCGEGKVTAELASQVPNGSVTGIDQSAAMISLAQTRFPSDPFTNLYFQQMDARQLTFHNQFDRVFSNATLHWVDDHQAVLQGLQKGLKPQGRLLLQMGGKGNVVGMIEAVQTVIQHSQWSPYFQGFAFPYYFYSPDDYQQWLPAAGLKPLRLELIPKDMVHANPTGLAGWIRTTWLPYVQRVPEESAETFVSAIVDQYLQQYPVTEDGKTHVAMIRLEVEASKD